MMNGALNSWLGDEGGVSGCRLWCLSVLSVAEYPASFFADVTKSEDSRE